MAVEAEELLSDVMSLGSTPYLFKVPFSHKAMWFLTTALQDAISFTRSITSWLNVVGQNTCDTSPLLQASCAVSFLPQNNISFACETNRLLEILSHNSPDLFFFSFSILACYFQNQIYKWSTVSFHIAKYFKRSFGSYLRIVQVARAQHGFHLWEMCWHAWWVCIADCTRATVNNAMLLCQDMEYFVGQILPCYPAKNEATLLELLWITFRVV